MSAGRVFASRVMPGQVLEDGRTVVGVRSYPEYGNVMLALDDGAHRFVMAGWQLQMAEVEVVPDEVPAEWSR